MKRNTKISSFFSKKVKTNTTNEEIEVIADDAKSDHASSTSSDTDTESQSIYPSYWPTETWLHKIKENPWLFVSKTYLGSKICKQVGSLGVNKLKGLKISVEWSNNKITCYGDTVNKKRQSVRKKMHEHEHSLAHLKCVSILSKANDNDVQNSMGKLQHLNDQNTCRIFRSVYALMKANRPLTDLPWLVDLQVLNGISMGRLLQSEKSFAEIANHIADEMRINIIKVIKEGECKIGIMIDESTTISKKTALSICLRAVLPNSKEANSIFLKFVELPDTTATTIVDTLLCELNTAGLDYEYLKMHLVSFATDGASNMLGKKNGVASIVSQKFPSVILWHCSNHRLELAVHDVVEEMHEVILFIIILFINY